MPDDTLFYSRLVMLTNQVPQHVTALLSHLTSRPGVQSTFILSRRDGSIIQSTGLLAASLARNQSPSQSQSQSPGQGPRQAEAGSTQPGTGSEAQQGTPEAEGASSASTPTGAAHEEDQEGRQEPTQGPERGQQKTPYQPTHAEALAAHIFAFVSSASDLSLSLSHPPETVANNGPSQGAELNGNDAAESLASANANGVSSPRDDEGDGHENQEDDEVKLLRLRTRKHEIVVVPDRKYLLCVVHDAVNAGRR